jgi:hypothetical protein
MNLIEMLRANGSWEADAAVTAIQVRDSRIAKLEAALREIEAHPEPYLYADEMAIIAYNALDAE